MSSASIAVPNVSEGRDNRVIQALQEATEREGARIVDVHSDGAHHRSVFTVVGTDDELVTAGAELARACMAIDLLNHSGVHPRLGALDVYPFVVQDDPGAAVDAAHRSAEAIWESTRVPVYLYGLSARRDETRELPLVRRGGLVELARRARDELPPDVGDRRIDPRHGVVCVGARPPLVAFNVWIRADVAVAGRIATRVRTSGGGPPGIRAMGVFLGDGTSQVSMNLTSPDVTGVERAFDEVVFRAEQEGVAVIASEIVGVPFERHLPDPNSKAARLLIEPDRSLESVLPT